MTSPDGTPTHDQRVIKDAEKGAKLSLSKFVKEPREHPTWPHQTLAPGEKAGRCVAAGGGLGGGSCPRRGSLCAIVAPALFIFFAVLSVGALVATAA
jgi:hypothetical protein